MACLFCGEPIAPSDRFCSPECCEDHHEGLAAAPWDYEIGAHDDIGPNEYLDDREEFELDQLAADRELDDGTSWGDDPYDYDE